MEWLLLKRVAIELPHDLATLLLGVCPREMKHVLTWKLLQHYSAQLKSENNLTVHQYMNKYIRC
jgi:hypothetical protein